jgi:hypothetical protein
LRDRRRVNLGDEMEGSLGDFLRDARGRSFCDGCLAIELEVDQIDVKAVLDRTAVPMDRGHGRCSVCGQTLTVTRVAE